jgi:hypothetical protein
MFSDCYSGNIKQNKHLDYRQIMNLKSIIFTLLICTVFPSAEANAQKVVISLTGGLCSNTIIRFTSLDGGGGNKGKGEWHSGFSLNKKVRENIWLGGGIVYALHLIENTPEYFPDVEIVSETETIQLLSVPLEVRFGFLKYFFFTTGPSLDFDISDDSPMIDFQTGIGWSAGIGAGIEYRKVYFMLNPAIRIHSLIAFNHEQNQQHLSEAGLSLGIGYTF